MSTGLEEAFRAGDHAAIDPKVFADVMHLELQELAELAGVKLRHNL
jgi:hypothetical protein